MEGLQPVTDPDSEGHPGPVRVLLLGPIEVIGPAGIAAFSGYHQRTLVGLLAASTPRLVPRTTLLDALWGEDPPRTAVKTLHSHIARVRRALDACGLPGVLVTRDPGYLLSVRRGSVDAHLFADGVRRGREHLAGGDPAAAIEALRTALARWRGDAFADARPVGAAATEIDRWQELRIGASIDLWDAHLRLGRHALAAAGLEPLVSTYPLRERLVELLMLALYQGDRQADALRAYERLRERLADELGVNPGPAVQRLYRAILRGHPIVAGVPAPLSLVDVPPPAQLPAPVGHFTGRTAEMEELDRVLDGARPTVLLLTGAAGMGKTSLAVQWAHRVSARFPDGQIFLDLRGDAGTPVPQALAHVLVSLGVPAQRVPADEAGQVGLYRTLLGTRRVLIVADGAATAEDVLPLVPPDPAALLVVTARVRLTALGTHHAVHTVGLDVLHHHEAVTLLTRLLGEHRVSRERDATAELAELCGRMPLALRIAAAKLAARPAYPISELVAELATERRLDELSVDGDSRSLSAVFASAYQVLSAPAAGTFRRLGLLPGATVSVSLTSAVTGLPLPDARRRLAELATAHLLTEGEHDRYRFHDLIGLYARQCAIRDEPALVRAETLDRMLDWYLAIADAANRILASGRDRITPDIRYPLATLPFTDTAPAALEFLDHERANLLAVVDHAANRPGSPIAWQLTYLLTGFFDARGHWAQRLAMCRLGIAAAQQAGEAGIEGLMRSGFAVACIMSHRYDQALPELHRALALMRASGDRRGEAHVENNIAVAYAGLRRFEEAVEAYHRALALHSTQDNRVGVALALNNIGDAYVRMGRPELGAEYFTRSLSLSRVLRNGWLEGAVLSGLGQSDLASEDLDGALAHFQEALAVRRQTGERRYEADTLHHLGVTYLRRGDYREATEQLRRALALSQEIADQHLEALALHSLGRTYLSQGDLTAARGYLRLAQALRSRVPDPYQSAAIEADLTELTATASEEQLPEPAHRAGGLEQR